MTQIEFISKQLLNAYSNRRLDRNAFLEVISTHQDNKEELFQALYLTCQYMPIFNVAIRKLNGFNYEFEDWKNRNIDQRTNV